MRTTWTKAGGKVSPVPQQYKPKYSQPSAFTRLDPPQWLSNDWQKGNKVTQTLS